MHTLLILDPGHFHGALVLREPHPDLSDDIYVYAQEGPDLDRFMQMADSFNQRKHAPTGWHIHVYTGADYLEKLIEEKKGDVVVIAGKNSTKMQHIEKLNRAGFSVLADKPWVTSEAALPFLESAMGAERPVTLDIMTERFEITTLLQKEFLAEEDVLGKVRIDEDGSPSILKESIHHLYKIVNQQPLIRPPWYFDINVQGEGIIDVSTHLVDMTHWMLFPDALLDFEQDIELLDARRWSTLIPLDKFSKITKLDQFPDAVQNDLTEDGLSYFCNGEIFYRVKNIPVHFRVIWNLEIPEGGGDTHRSLIKGTRSDLLIRQLPQRGFKVELLIVPRENPADVEAAVRGCLEKWAHKYPGLSLSREQEKILIHIPDALRTTHEEHFCKVRDMYLRYLDQGVPPETRACIVAKYRLLAEARKLALKSPHAPLGLMD
jgi:predicted dehydrogenase